MVAVEWLAWLVLLFVAAGAGAVITMSNSRVAREVRDMAQTYRRQKSLELEHLQIQELRHRQAEVDAQLSAQGPDGWKPVLNQLLTDALPDQTGEVKVGAAGMLHLSAEPPQFLVDGDGEHVYLITTAPPPPSGRFRALFGDRGPLIVPLDASLSPAARIEAQAIWQHLISKSPQYRNASLPHLPRQAEWYLVVRQRGQNQSSERAAGLPG